MSPNILPIVVILIIPVIIVFGTFWGLISNFIRSRKELYNSDELRGYKPPDRAGNVSYSQPGSFKVPVIPNRSGEKRAYGAYAPKERRSVYAPDDEDNIDYSGDAQDYSSSKHYADKEGQLVNRMSDEVKYSTGYNKNLEPSEHNPRFAKSRIKQYSHTFEGHEPWDSCLPKEKDPWDKDFRA